MPVLEIIKSTRPKQWMKNLIIYMPLVFSRYALDPAHMLNATAAFGIFCLLSGAVYIFNDLQDLEEDKRHPVKSSRPLAAGRLTKSQALAAFFLLATASLAPAFLLSFDLFVAVLIYLAMNLAYSLRLKNVVILDLFIIAGGFLVRVVAGGLVIDVFLSPWLLICTFLLALFLAMCKRRHELLLLEQDAPAHRPILKEYSPLLLDQMIAVVTASTVMAYCLYTISDATVAKFGTTNLIFTAPFVVYGIFRYLYLVHQKAQGGTPESLLIKDKPLLLVVFFWVSAVILILYL